MKQERGWKPTNRQLVTSYIIGFYVCCITQFVVLREEGPIQYVNLLSVPLYIFHEIFHEMWWFTAGPELSPERHANIFSFLASSTVVAVFFPAALSLLRFERKLFRGIGWVLLGVLTLMSVIWGRAPNI